MKEYVLLWKAIHALVIDVPVLSYEILGAEAIELKLYGGKVVSYTVPAEGTGDGKPDASAGKRTARVDGAAGGKPGAPAGKRAAQVEGAAGGKPGASAGKRVAQVAGRASAPAYRGGSSTPVGVGELLEGGQ